MPEKKKRAKKRKKLKLPKYGIARIIDDDTWPMDDPEYFTSKKKAVRKFNAQVKQDKKYEHRYGPPDDAERLALFEIKEIKP